MMDVRLLQRSDKSIDFKGPNPRSRHPRHFVLATLKKNVPNVRSSRIIAVGQCATARNNAIAAHKELHPTEHTSWSYCSRRLWCHRRLHIGKTAYPFYDLRDEFISSATYAACFWVCLREGAIHANALR